MKFALALHTDDGKSFGVSVPALPGCFSAGDTLSEAVENAREAIDGHVELLAEDGDKLPEEHAFEDFYDLPEYEGAIWYVAEVNLDRYYGPSKKINITLPFRALEEIDRFAKEHHESRSGFLLRAAREYMAANK